MKKNLLVVSSMVVAASVFIGCSKQENSPMGDVKKSMGDAADQVKKSAESATEKVKDATAEAAKKVEGAAGQLSPQLTEAVSKVKTFIADKKYPEALATIKETAANAKLTPDQQKMLDGLKEQVQKLMAGAQNAVK